MGWLQGKPTVVTAIRRSSCPDSRRSSTPCSVADPNQDLAADLTADSTGRLVLAWTVLACTAMLLLAACCLLVDSVAGIRLAFVISRPRAYRLPVACDLLLAACCLRTACCLLPTAYCLLPAAYHPCCTAALAMPRRSPSDPCRTRALAGPPLLRIPVVGTRPGGALCRRTKP